MSEKVDIASLIIYPYRAIQIYPVIETNRIFKNIFQQRLNYQYLS